MRVLKSALAVSLALAAASASAILDFFHAVSIRPTNTIAPTNDTEPIH